MGFGVVGTCLCDWEDVVTERGIHVGDGEAQPLLLPKSWGGYNNDVIVFMLTNHSKARDIRSIL